MSGLPLRPNCYVHFTKGSIISNLTNVQLPWAPGKHWHLVKPSWEPHGHYFFLKVHIFSDGSAEGIFFFFLKILCNVIHVGEHCHVYVAWALIILKESVTEAGVSQCLQYRHRGPDNSLWLWEVLCVSGGVSSARAFPAW